MVARLARPVAASSTNGEPEGSPLAPALWGGRGDQLEATTTLAQGVRAGSKQVRKLDHLVNQDSGEALGLTPPVHKEWVVALSRGHVAVADSKRRWPEMTKIWPERGLIASPETRSIEHP